MSITDYLEQQRSKSFDDAEKAGLDVVTPADNEIQLDIDRPWPFHEPTSDSFDAILELLPKRLRLSFCEYFSVLSCRAWRSHGGNTHAVLTLSQDLSPQARIALQAVLGSDPIRELLSLVRVENGCQDPIALFRPRYTNEGGI